MTKKSIEESKEFLESEYKRRSLGMRRQILKTIHKAGSGHPGGSLSVIDILNILYFYKLTHNPHLPSDPSRDRLIFSKGHASPALYTVLAEAGYFPSTELERFRKLGALLQGHAHREVPGVEFSTGSLGQGLSAALGLALGGRLQGEKYSVFAILGDGEMQEGSIWEALMAGGHYRVGNLCGILDYNKIQENGPVSEILALEPLAEKLRAFNWEVVEADGHNFTDLKRAFDCFPTVSGKPLFIIAHTVKGKVISFMENNPAWHGKAPGEKDLKVALDELV